MDGARITIEAFARILNDGLPGAAELGMEALELGPGTAVLRLPFDARLIRPGGTVSGPSLFALADCALYGAVLSLAGPVELAVTTSMTINFLRKPAQRPVIGKARILKHGKRLSYGEVLLFSEGEGDPVAHATGTYSIPAPPAP
ncbi:MAG TPA: PaaI family thioesterase [Azospirillaceae bacterium]|nr:PaaI family thioesterase [Azospirillaceae bacterium]